MAATTRSTACPSRWKSSAVDGLTALGRWDRNEYGALPADVRPEDLTDAERASAGGLPHRLDPRQPLSRGACQRLVQGAPRPRRLLDRRRIPRPPHRHQPLCLGPLRQPRRRCWKRQFGDIDWSTIHDAATAKGGWPELGGDPSWGFFKLVVPNPSKNVGGLAAMIAMAGEYYDRTDISVEDVTNPEFQAWLTELMGAVTDFSSASAYTAEDFALFGYSVGDGGQLLESDLLQNMQGIVTRWEDPLRIYYPDYVTWFDFPFTRLGRPGNHRPAKERRAGVPALPALRRANSRPRWPSACAPPTPTLPWMPSRDSLFAQWQDQGVQSRRAPHLGHAQPGPRRTA